MAQYKTREGVFYSKPPAMSSKRPTIYDRLSDPSTFTGVYAQRFTSGPGINQDGSDASRYRCPLTVGPKCALSAARALDSWRGPCLAPRAFCGLWTAPS